MNAPDDYKLLALDIDGTLIGAQETVAPELVEALARAETAGLRVLLVTGRTHRQAVGIWRQLRRVEPPLPIALVSGAMVSEPDTGRTLYQKTLPRALACQAAAILGDGGRSVLALVDGWRGGVDYFVAPGSDLELLQRKWLSRENARVRRVESLDQAPDLPDPLRVSAIVAQREEGEDLAERLRKRFEGELCINVLAVPAYDMTIVEATDLRANKWTAVLYVAQAERIRPAEIVAVGDDTNDLPMIRSAGLGVAMPHAPPALRQAARAIAEGGLAAFVRGLLAGRRSGE